MAGDVRQPPRQPFPDQHAQHAVPPRWVTDCLTLRLGDPLCHELDHVLAVGAEHAQGTVLRVDQLTSRVHDPGQDVSQL